MIRDVRLEIAENAGIASDIYRMTLVGDTGVQRQPGQFVNIRLQGQYLRRPISVCSASPGKLVLIYKVVGKGTAQMAQMQPGQALEMLIGLGNGFDARPAKGKHIALIGGGVGVPPLYGLMEALCGEKVHAVLGFGTKSDAFYAEEFDALGAKVAITTMDGSLGQKGLVTDALAEIEYDYYFACGPEPMLRAVHALSKQRGAQGQLSFEARMACGFGACMGCTCRTIAGYKRICADGPVLSSEEVTL